RGARRFAAVCERRDAATIVSPCWKHLPKDAWRVLALNLIREIEEEAALRMSRTGRQPLGAAAVSGQHPHDRPRNSKRSPAPLFHAVSARVRRELREAYPCSSRPSERRQKSSERETATPSFRSAASLQPYPSSEDDPEAAPIGGGHQGKRRRQLRF